MDNELKDALILCMLVLVYILFLIFMISSSKYINEEPLDNVETKKD